MKLHLHADSARFTITGHGAGFVAVNGREIRTPLAVSPDDLVEPWALVGATPTAEDFLALISLPETSPAPPSLVIFGAGPRFQMPSPAIMAALYTQGIGFEAMDTPAACRTYNVLVSEGRSVIAALLV